MSPNETLFLESTNKIYKDDISNSSFVNFQIWDFPGQMDFFDPTFDYEMIFRGTGALIYVIDAQVVRNNDVYFSGGERCRKGKVLFFVMCFLTAFCYLALSRAVKASVKVLLWICKVLIYIVGK